MPFQNERGVQWILLRRTRLKKQKKTGPEFGRVELVLVFWTKQQKKRKEPHTAKENLFNAKFLWKKGDFLYYAVLGHDHGARIDLSKDFSGSS